MFKSHLVLIFILSVCFISANAQVSFVECSLLNGLKFEYKEALKMGGGAASFDYDNDGDEDLYIVGGQNPDGLFENDGTGNFLDISVETNISSLTNSLMTTSVVTGDIDNDGIREIFVGTIGNIGTNLESIRPNLLLRYNTSTSKFENIIESVLVTDKSFCMGAHFFDSNLDGYLDLYLINYISDIKLIQEGSDVIGFDHKCFENRLYINSGDGTFTDQTEFYGLDNVGCSLAATASDLDWDGDSDIIVANDFGKWLEPNQLFQNEGGDKPYLDISEQSNANAMMYGMGIGVGDYDEDLDLDFYVTNIGENFFFENEGNMVFSNKAEELDIQNTTTENGLLTTGWGAILEDFDNDSYLDLFVSNGYVYSAVDVDDTDQPDELYLGSSDHTFTNATENCGIDFYGPSRGALFGDWNMDGQLDLITITNEITSSEDLSSINYYKNTSNQGNWVSFKLIGTNSNIDAFGAKVVLCADNRKILRELRGGDSHASQSSSFIHFGLSDIEEIDSVLIYWPSGLTENIQNASINTYNTIIEGLVSSNEQLNNNPMEYLVYPNPANHILNIVLPNEANSTHQVRLYNSMGQIVLTRQLKNGINQINTSQLSAGIYTLVNISNTQRFKNKTIILTPLF